jgi:hypothetical protein
VKKCGLFVKKKKLREIRKADIQQWIGELKKEELFELKITHIDFSNKYAPEL